MTDEEREIESLLAANARLSLKIKNIRFQSHNMTPKLELAYYQEEMRENSSRIEALKLEIKKQRFTGLKSWLTVDEE